MVDTSAIFEEFCMCSVVLVGPAVVLVALIIVARFIRLGSLGVLGFAIWIACVAFAHLWIIAAAAASI